MKGMAQFVLSLLLPRAGDTRAFVKGGCMSGGHVALCEAIPQPLRTGPWPCRGLLALKVRAVAYIPHPGAADRQVRVNLQYSPIDIPAMYDKSSVC